MKKLLFMMMSLLALPLVGLADAVWGPGPSAVHVGEEAVFSFACDGQAVVTVLDAYGQALVKENYPAGNDSFTLKDDLPVGQYVLRLFSEGNVAQRTLTVTDNQPEVRLVEVPHRLDENWMATVSVNRPGILSVGVSGGAEGMRLTVDEGETSFEWFGPELAKGNYTLFFSLQTEDGVCSETVETSVAVLSTPLASDETFFSPDDVSGVSCEHPVCYWRMNMGETNEETIWQVLTAPVTVLNGNERHQCKIRKEPSDKCKDYVGEVTYVSQAVHVLERGEEWTLIEAYSSSVEGSSVGVWAAPFQGYVKTSLLKEVQVSQKIGLVIDKLQQRLYVFQDGKLFSTLLCSTGFARKDTPFHETPAGEFLAISWTGGFWSGSLYCDMAIRINDGILLHEVPCLVNEQADGTKVRDYDRCERYLGEKASHGCVRIQRLMSPEGVNAKWLWDHLPRTGAKAKVLIWDDAGRTLGYPDDHLSLYYNPNGGKNYHSHPQCAAVKEKYWPLTSFPYGELGSAPFSKLTPCLACAPQLTHQQIDQLNASNPKPRITQQEQKSKGVDGWADEVPMYYNPNGGQFYHEDPQCATVGEQYWPLTLIDARELGNPPFDQLRRCTKCVTVSIEETE